MKLPFQKKWPLFAVLLAGTSPLSAGPPFQTDDPEPVPQYHGEIYFASQITKSVAGVSGTAPHGEINYGILPETQLHLIVPIMVNSPSTGNVAFGVGDIEFGVKYRFMEEDGTFPEEEHSLTLNILSAMLPMALAPVTGRFSCRYGCRKAGDRGQPMAEEVIGSI